MFISLSVLSFQLEAGKPIPGGAAGSEGVLQNFFNSLLSKKTGQGVVNEMEKENI